MPSDIKYLLVFLIIALIVLIYLQNQQCSVIPNEGSLTRERNGSNNNIDSKNAGPRMALRRDARQLVKDTRDVARDVGKVMRDAQPMRPSAPVEVTEDSSSGSFENPLPQNVNRQRYNVPDVDQAALNKLMEEVNTGNDLPVNSRQNEIFGQRSNSINKAKGGYRKVSYADSAYRYDFNGTGEKTGMPELDKLYSESLVFGNNENALNNNNFQGFPDGDVKFTKNKDDITARGFMNPDEKYSSADLKNFTPQGPQSQKDKVLRLYDSEEYLPNEKLLNNDLTKGFQILENPVSVKNPNLIPVLKSIPVSSVLGSKRNSTWDIRAEPPNPKTVVSPFLNSSIMPDIYATNRGCL